jgi:HlyD family secretion protein
MAAEARAHEVEMAEATLRRAGDEVRAALAALAEAGQPGPDGVAVRSPAAGRVLRVLHESEGPVAAGTPLLEIGDPERLETRVDLLSTDAVRVRPGAPVQITRWGGDQVLRGTVRRVEPSAFTKVSALGVEEQRVYVVVDPAGDGWGALGDGFAVEARIVVSDRGDVPQVPASALFRRGDGWATFVADGGRARLRTVRTGGWSSAAAEIVDGVAPGERVVVHPSDRLSDGARIAIGD